MEILHKENPVLTLYWPCKGLQCSHKQEHFSNRNTPKDFQIADKWEILCLFIMTLFAIVVWSTLRDSKVFESFDRETILSKKHTVLTLLDLNHEQLVHGSIE